MLIIKNTSNYSTSQVKRLVVESFGSHGEIKDIDNNSFSVCHANDCCNGTYVFTGSLFAKVC